MLNGILLKQVSMVLFGRCVLQLLMAIVYLNLHQCFPTSDFGQTNFNYRTQMASIFDLWQCSFTSPSKTHYLIWDKLWWLKMGWYKMITPSFFVESFGHIMIHVGHIIFLRQEKTITSASRAMYISIVIFSCGKGMEKIHPKSLFVETQPTPSHKICCEHLWALHKVSCVVDSQKYFDYQRRLYRSHFLSTWATTQKVSVYLGLHSLPHVFFFRIPNAWKITIRRFFPRWNLKPHWSRSTWISWRSEGFRWEKVVLNLSK